MDKQIPIIIGNIHLDETYHKVKKKNVYRWSAKDKNTKYRLYWCLTKRKDYETGAKPLFKHLKKNCYKQFLSRKKAGQKNKIHHRQTGTLQKRIQQILQQSCRNNARSSDSMQKIQTKIQQQLHRKRPPVQQAKIQNNERIQKPKIRKRNTKEKFA